MVLLGTDQRVRFEQTSSWRQSTGGSAFSSKMAKDLSHVDSSPRNAVRSGCVVRGKAKKMNDSGVVAMNGTRIAAGSC